MPVRQLFALLVALCLARASAQAPANATPQLSPQAAYDQAVRPLEITRRSPQNWSEAELDALKIATEEAKTSCHARAPDQFAGEDFLAYALLCAFAQEWAPVQVASSLYLAAYEKADPDARAKDFPSLSKAFDYKVQASLHLKDPDTALATSRDMLRTVPWDGLASDATGSTVRYIQLIQNQHAVSLLLQRQPILLALLKAHPTTGPPAHALYADAIALPAMQQFANQPKDAESSFAELEASLPADISSDDAILIAETRRQYKLLGGPLPKFTTTAWLLDPAAPAMPDPQTSFGAATVFLLFPDWCNQCLAVGPRFAPQGHRLNETEARFYALLAQATPPPKPAPKENAKSGKSTRSAAPATLLPGEKPGLPRVDLSLTIKPTAAALLVETPTFAVPKETLNSFVATDFPLIVVVDHSGIVRNIQVAPDTALVPGGLIDQLAAWVVERWPRAR
ncbi:hypothetical protein [Granulicella sibirica]|uniref:Thioredoxin domain-containing protein n=1 Tax=Granulicella sibirica TaxID=2479048 RepID=A0A4Q0T6W1_9BACT|nr:hypothetical protein [Granulicella sibirica]RXH57779.1 hypothetical protein GRAN_1089 [Granulicella sibirica]